MPEKIQKIVEIEDEVRTHEVDDKEFKRHYTAKESFCGYEIITDQRRIKFLIEDGQECCEEWGYLASSDQLDVFVGSKLLDVRLVDDKLNSIAIPETREFASTIFVNVYTSEGLLQFAAYNAHNGYYGHRVIVEVGETSLVDEKL